MKSQSIEEESQGLTMIKKVLNRVQHFQKADYEQILHLQETQKQILSYLKLYPILEKMAKQ